MLLPPLLKIAGLGAGTFIIIMAIVLGILIALVGYQTSKPLYVTSSLDRRLSPLNDSGLPHQACSSSLRSLLCDILFFIFFYSVLWLFLASSLLSFHSLFLLMLATTHPTHDLSLPLARTHLARCSLFMLIGILIPVILIIVFAAVPKGPRPVRSDSQTTNSLS